MLNKVMLIGNLVRDPEGLRYTSSGTAVTSLTVASNRKFGDKEDVSFIDVTVWGKTAEFAEKYLTKGRSILIEGRLSQDSYEDKDGNKRSKTYVTAETINFVGPKPKDSDDSGPESDDPVEVGAEVPF